MSTFAVALAFFVLVAGTLAAFLQTAGRAGYGALKMLAATGYLAFALTLGALNTTYGAAIFIALALSWLGDLFLIGEARAAFLAGLVAFLLAHVAYAAAFALGGLAPGAVAAGAAGMVIVAVVVLRWLRSGGLPQAMVTPVAAYLVAIGVMVAFAAGTGSWTVLVGAAAFAVSDIFVARHRFVTQAAINRRVGLPLYFAAQLLLAWSVA
jgi:uncharacterized membrane protein YhhN